MAKSSPADVIDAYRRRQKRRFPFTFADLSKALLLLIILAALAFIVLTGTPELPPLVELQTNTATLTPSITPTRTPTATITSTPSITPDPDNQCDCPSPVIVVITATFEATTTSHPFPVDTVTIVAQPTSASKPAETPAPTETLLPTPTQILYTVQQGDTLGGIALKFGVTIEAIQILNNLGSTMIYLGQVLQIPGP